MKKVISAVASLSLLLSLFLFSGCSGRISKNEPQVITSFPKDTAPSQVVKTEKQWVMLHSTYSSRNYSISFGESLDSRNTIYTAEDVSIWYFEANNKAIVWCEKSSEYYTYKIYNFSTQDTETVFQCSIEAGFQPQNVGIFLNCVYYCFIDYQQETVGVFAYDIDAKTTTEVCSVAFQEDQQPYSINLENEFLSFVCASEAKVLDLQNNEVVFDSPLPSTVEHVFGISYDIKNDTCALYYADSDSEYIGIFKEGDDKISSVFTFSQNHYAYQDKLECYDGHIYWIAQANVSGAVADHYRLVDYNYIEHHAVETSRTFAFYRNDDSLYVLRFNNDGDYTHIDMCQ